MLNFLDRSLEKFLLSEGHLTGFLFCPFVFIADQMENSVDHQQDDHSHFIETESLGLTPGRLDGYHNISKEMGMENRELSLPHREGQDVCWIIPMEVLLIQCLDLKIIDKQEAELCIKKLRFGQYPSGHFSYFS